MPRKPRTLALLAATALCAILVGCASKPPNTNIGIYNHFDSDSKSFVVSGGTGVNAQLRPETVNKSAAAQAQTPGDAITGSAADQAIVTGTNITSSRATDTAATIAQVAAKQAQAGTAGNTTGAQDAKQDDQKSLAVPVSVTGNGAADSNAVAPSGPAPNQ